MNQLFPSLIGLSPLTTGHPRLFQQTWVRPSSTCYRTFSLPMARSPGFGSNPTNSRPIKTRFRYASAYRLKLARKTKSLTHYTRGTPSPARQRRARYHLAPRANPEAARARREWLHDNSPPWVSRLRLLVGIRFQGLFHSPHRGAFHLSLTVLVHYRSLRST